MRSARPPKAAAGSPPPMTFPKVNRSASTGSSPYQPERETRKPVMTSSRISSAPCAAVIRRSAELNPSSGGTTPMLPAAASLMTQAMSLPRSAKTASTAGASLYGSTTGSGGGPGGGPGGAGGGAGGDAGGVRQPEGRAPRARRGQQRVDVPVVVPGELDDQRPAGGPPGQPDRGEHGLGAGVPQPHPLDRWHPVANLLRQVQLALGRGAEGETPAGRGGDRLHDSGVRVPEDQWPPRADQVDVAPSVGIGDPGTGPLHHEAGGSADGAEGADRAVHPARDDRLATGEEVGRDRGLVGVGGAVQRGHGPSVPREPEVSSGACGSRSASAAWRAAGSRVGTRTVRPSASFRGNPVRPRGSDQPPPSTGAPASTQESTARRWSTSTSTSARGTRSR